jgi:hypothetical protein
MSDQYRDKCVRRRNKNRGKEDPIRVSFYDLDGQLIDDVTRKEAECIAALNPKQTFYFQDSDAYRRELSIGGVKKLTINDAVKPGIPPCPTSPQLCGPPKVRFFGGGGFGAMANAVISPNSSSIIGFDIVNPGFGYLSPPYASIEDTCGNGFGGSGKVQTRPSSKGGLEVRNIIVTSTGDGYLPAPNGSKGGNGRTIVGPNQGYVETVDGTIIIFNPGNQPPLNPGDIVFPPTSTVPVVPTPTAPIPTAPIPTVPTQIAPIPTVPTQIVPTLTEPVLTYPAITEIEEIFVSNPGFNYNPGDTIEVISVPEGTSRGAVLKPVINDRGEIESVEVVKPGSGFIDLPRIIVNSPTGYNAQLIPILKIIPLSSIPNPETVERTAVISIVDCVGKIDLPDQEMFDIVPR